MRAFTAVAILCLAAEVAMSVAFPLPAERFPIVQEDPTVKKPIGNQRRPGFNIVHVDPGAKQKGPGTSHPPLSLPAESSRLNTEQPSSQSFKFMSVDPSQPKKTRPSRKLWKVTPKPPSDQPGSSSNQPGPPLSDTRRKKNRPGQPQTSGPAVVPIGPLSDTRHQPPPGSPPPPQVPHRSSNRPWEWGPTPT